MDKNVLRRQLWGQAVTKEESEDACRLIASDEWVRNAHIVFLYHPMADEPDIRPLYEGLGKPTALPFMHSDGLTMDFSLYEGRLVEGRYGIMECERKEIVTPSGDDVIIVPALAYSSDGVRLGRGKGCYDRYLRRCPAKTIGISTRARLFDTLPREEHDVRVDKVLIAGPVA